MKSDETHKIVIRLPHDLYHKLRNQAYQHNLSLPEFLRQSIELKPSRKEHHAQDVEGLSSLSVKEMLLRTQPRQLQIDERLDFFHG